MPIPTIRPYPMPEDVPAGVAGWQLDPRRAVLLIHDMQRYFLSFFPENASPVRELVGNVRLIRDACAAGGIPVAYTAQPGGMTSGQRGLLMDVWGPGMPADDELRRIVEEVAPGPLDEVFTKWRYSALHRTGLLDSLNRQGRDQLVICGVYAHVGCLFTAVDAFSHDIETFLVADAIADFSAKYHRLAVDYAAERCAMTPTTASVLRSLSRTGVPR